MRKAIYHPYHLVDESPWPLMSSLGALTLTLGLVKWFFYSSASLFFLGTIIISITRFQWWRDVSRERRVLGLHTRIVELGLRWGIILFIVSEIFFFVSFFWAFFHNSLRARVEVGARWPPSGILIFNPWEVPLLNTIILLSSGVSVTWAHHSLIAGNHDEAAAGLTITIILGAVFTGYQAIEYHEASFCMSDSIYGSTFYLATGFHGIHVLIGTSFLLICLIRLILGVFSATHHFGFEAAAWYWHFVDVVWLFLYVSIYWWGRLLG